VQRLSALCYFATPRATTHASWLAGGTLRSLKKAKGAGVGVTTTK